MSNAYLREELRVGLTCPGFEITAEGIWDQPYDGGYLLEVDLLREMAQRIVIDGIDALAFLFGKIMTEPDG